MPELSTSLSRETLREIIKHLDESISLMELTNGRHTIGELKIKSMLTALRRQLHEHLHQSESAESSYY